MRSGIYCITNKRDGKVYVGSAVDTQARRNQHFCLLRARMHPNKHLQAAYNRDGEGNFDFIVLETVGKRSLRKREQAWIDARHAADRRHGYNKSPQADRPRGYRWTEAMRRAQSRRKHGIPWSSQRRLAYSPWTWKQAKAAVCKSRQAKLLQYAVVSPNNREYRVDDLKKFCCSHDLGYPNMSGVSRGYTRHHKGWRCYRLLEGETVAQAVLRTEELFLARLPAERARSLRYFYQHKEACREKNRIYCKTRRKRGTRTRVQTPQ